MATSLAYTGTYTATRGDRFKAWLATDTDRRRDEMAALIVREMDVDMRLRVVRAAADGLTMFYPGVAILDACDEIEREMAQEDAERGL